MRCPRTSGLLVGVVDDVDEGIGLEEPKKSFFTKSNKKRSKKTGMMIKFFFFTFVRETGLEPACLAAHAP